LKKNIIVKDEFDYNDRMLLNFGHTIGHALESYYQYKNIMHGEAVYYGMMSASYISWKLDCLSKDDYNNIYNFINTIPKKKLINANTETLKNHLMFDKKRKGNKNNFILLNDIGSAMIKNNISESIIDQSLKLLIN
jgi:3-dehydroquinate synthase